MRTKNGQLGCIEGNFMLLYSAEALCFSVGI